MIAKDDDPDDFREHVRAVSLRRDKLVVAAEQLAAETWRRLEEAGIDRAVVDALARAMGSPPAIIPFETIFAALADRLGAQAATARDLATEWAAWNRRVADLEEEGHLRALTLEGPEAARIH